ncbi:hypothetical protein KBZ21_41225, partial [Streptomyces sp. A73]|nr:hypothetical protein [Streptomyces sp. A73]
EVWARIKASGVRYHWAYDKGMKRLSCSFCVLASREDLECAARPTRAEAYRQVADELALMQSVEPDHRHAAGLYSAEQCARR